MLLEEEEKGVSAALAFVTSSILDVFALLQNN